jgi:hypothetical protein
MADTNSSKGIFHGTDEIASAFFDLRPGKILKQKSTCRRLVPIGIEQYDFETLVADLYGKVEKNRSDHPPSRENWRSERQITLNSQNRSPEILLERAIAILGERGFSEGWFNQVPVASGLVNGSADRRAAIDLVRHRNDKAEFIELKWESDTPAYAAFEILRYGLAYLLSYINRETFDYAENPLMRVREVSLRVLAPRIYYDDYVDCDLTWLSEGLDLGLRTLVAQKTDGALSMDFGFYAFPPDFSPPFAKGEDVLSMMDLAKDTEPCQQLISALCGIEQIWCNAQIETSRS